MIITIIIIIVLSARRPYLIINNNNKKKKKKKNNKQTKNKGTFKIVDFVVLDDHRIKLNDNEKKDKYPDIARNEKN